MIVSLGRRYTVKYDQCESTFSFAIHPKEARTLPNWVSTRTLVVALHVLAWQVTPGTPNRDTPMTLRAKHFPAQKLVNIAAFPVYYSSHA